MEVGDAGFISATPRGLSAIYNTHLISTHPHDSYNKERLEQMRELAEFVGNNRDEVVATIIGGDFNFGPIETGEEPYFSLEYNWDDLIGVLFPGFFHATRLGCTWCPASNTLIEGEAVGEKIDHLLASKNLILKDARLVLDEAFETDSLEKKVINYSDHYGVEAFFEF